MHLALWYVVLVCHQYDVCKYSAGSVYVGGHSGLSESPSVPLQPAVMSYVNCGADGHVV